MKASPLIFSALVGLASADTSTTPTSTSTPSPTATNSSSNPELVTVKACKPVKAPTDGDTSDLDPTDKDKCFRFDASTSGASYCSSPLSGQLGLNYYPLSPDAQESGLTTELAWDNMTFPATWVQNCRDGLLNFYERSHPLGIIYTATSLETDSFVTLAQADKVCAVQVKANPSGGGGVPEGNGDKGFKIGDVDLQNVVKGSLDALLGFASTAYSFSGSMPCAQGTWGDGNQTFGATAPVGDDATWVKWRVVPLNGDGMVWADVHPDGDE